MSRPIAADEDIHDVYYVSLLKRPEAERQALPAGLKSDAVFRSNAMPGHSSPWPVPSSLCKADRTPVGDVKPGAA